MNEINANVFDMEKEQLKAALKGLAKSRNVSLSDLAVEAGVAPSTITGFINDVPGRGHYGLSARTQSKLADKFPEFKEQIDKPYVSNTLYNLPVIGMWHTDYRVLGLELGMPSTFTCTRYENIENYSSVIRSPKFFKKNLTKKGIVKHNIDEVRYYLFQNIYSPDLQETENKQIYATTETGNFIGYQVKDKGKYYLHTFFGDRIEEAGEVLKSSKIEWPRQV